MEKIDKLKSFIELPLGIQLKMLEFQVAAGNPMNSDVFKTDIISNTKSGGFDWDRFVSNSFWTEVLKGNYDLFFQKFPESEYPKFAFINNGKSYEKVLVTSNLNGNYNYIEEIKTLESFLINRHKLFPIQKISTIYNLEDIVKLTVNDVTKQAINTILVVENDELTIKTLSPKEKTFPRVMLVRQSVNSKWEKRVVIAYKCERYISWIDAETLENAENKISTTTWIYAKEIDEEFIVTKEEIANKFNIPIKNLIIK